MRPRIRRRHAVPDDGCVARISGLTVDFLDDGSWTNVLDNVGLSIGAGASVGLVGESGCGKTTTAYSLLGYRRPGSRIRGGSVQVLGRELIGAGWSELGRVRGGEVGFVSQNPTVALNPRLRVGEQIDETLRVHRVGGSDADRRTRIRQLLHRVGLPGDRPSDAFPHQLSGGQQQRVMIALALACDPQLVVLDEPTTGLDVTTQAQILELLNELRTTAGMAMLYVTHDLGVVAEVCDRVCVMYAGHVVEEGSVRDIFDNPRHPYTQGLISAVPAAQGTAAHAPKPLRGILQRHLLPAGCRFAPRCEHATERCFAEPQQLVTLAAGHRVACWRHEEIPASAPLVADRRQLQRRADHALLEVAGLDCSYQPRSRRPQLAHLVVRDVDLAITSGETLALVGESGSGKSTIARSLAGILTPVAGELRIDGQAIPWKVRQRSRDTLRSMQLVLQNPDASLNPRQRVERIIARPLEFYGLLDGRRAAGRVEELLADVRLDQRFAGRFPSELSGGERQRVALARALATNPKLVLCDEILSALDVSVQAEILVLMRRLQERDGTAYLFISHDLNVVRSIAHRVAVLYRGELCEVGLTDDVYQPPFHPYTMILLSSVPGAKRDTRERPPARTDHSPVQPQGCPLAATCPHKLGAVCDDTPPPWRHISDTHAIRCHATIDELRALGGPAALEQPAELTLPDDR